MTSIAVDIIVPAYNAAQTIAETLDSAITQNGVAEIIVIDDGSTDDTLDIARQYEARVKVLTGPNQGVSAARNRGIAKASAPWIVFLDADDILMPDTIMRRIETASGDNADVVVTDWVDLSHETGALGPRKSIDWLALEGDPEVATATHVWATTAALMYRRELIETIGGFRADLPIIQDARLLFDAAHRGARFVHLDHIGALYRVMAGSLSRRHPAQFWLDVLLNANQIEAAWLTQSPLDEKRLKAVSDCYSVAARGLLRAAHPSFFDAVKAQLNLGVRPPNFNRIATPIASLFGLRIASRLLRLSGRI